MTNQNINLLSVLDSKSFPGIGLALAQRLLERFGAEGLIERVRSASVEDLTSTQGISHAKANTLIIGARLNIGLFELALYLDSLGLAKPYAAKFHAVWGSKAVKIIKSNPYVLLVIMDWKDVDPLGLSLGNPYHPCRVIAAIEWCMYQDYEDDKNTCIDEITLASMVGNFINCDQATFRRGLNLALRTNAVVAHAGMYQVPATHWYERLVEKFLADNDRTSLTESQVDNWLNGSQHHLVTHEQRDAIKNALMYRISAYHGRGGRGKTWTLKAIADGAKDKSLLGKKRVILAAVAAKAVKRMQAETGFPSANCCTIASLIYVEKPEDLRDAMVIIDEASMLSMVDAFRIIRKLPQNTHIVMLGDKNQIPSIQAGRLFYDIIIHDAVPNKELKISQRHDGKTDGQLQQILDGYFPVFDDYKPESGSGLFRHLVVPANKFDDPIRIAEDRAVELYCNFIQRGETVQLISPLRNIKYAGSSESINRKAHLAVFGTSGAKGLCPGTPVVWTKNMTIEDGTLLSNGSIGFVHEVFRPGGEYSLSVAFEYEGIALLKWLEVKEYLGYAYCLSVHQAQGSEWENVIIVLPNSERMIDRNMVYTALSRCKKRSVIVYYDHDFIERKVTDPPAHERRRSTFLKGFKKDSSL